MVYGIISTPKNNYLCITGLLSIVNISSIFFSGKFPYIHIRISHYCNLYNIALIFLPMEIKSLLIKAILKERS